MLLDSIGHREALLDKTLVGTFPANAPIAPMASPPVVRVKDQTTMYKSHLDVAEAVRRASVALLQARLVTAIDLEAQLKQAHWNVKGQNFLQLHELFDKIHSVLEDFVDILAERIVALHGVADGRLQAVVGATTLDQYPIDAVSGEDHLRAVSRGLSRLAQRCART